MQQFWDSTRSTLLKNKSEFLQQGRLDIDKATSVLCRHLEERQIIELFDFLFEINWANKLSFDMRRQKIWCNISPVQINKHRNRQSPDSNKLSLYNIAAN